MSLALRADLKSYRYPAILIALFAIYFLAGKLALKLALIHPSASAVWPSTGIALAAALILGYRVWPAIFAGAFVVNITTAGSIATSLGIATGNTLEAIAGAWLVNRFAGGRNAFNRPPDAFRFVLLASLASTTISATIGVSSLALGGYAEWSAYSAVWLTWWLGDAVGALVIAPLLVLWSVNPRLGWSGRWATEASLLFASLLLVGFVVFGGILPYGHENYPLTFLVIPPLLWAAFRFGPREAATASFLLSAVATYGTLRESGPFARESANQTLLLLQAYMGTFAATAIGLAAVVQERRRADQERSYLADIVDSSSEAIIGLTLQGTITAWNLGAERVFGYRASEMHGQNVTRLILRQNRPDLPAIRDRILRGERVKSFRTAGLTKQGGRIDLSLAISPIKGASGKIEGISVAGQDISERKRSEERFQLAVESAPNAMVMVNQAGKIVLVNSQTEKLFGYGREELIGQPIEILVPAQFRNNHPVHRGAFLAEPRARAPWVMGAISTAGGKTAARSRSKSA